MGEIERGSLKEDREVEERERERMQVERIERNGGYLE